MFRHHIQASFGGNAVVLLHSVQDMRLWTVSSSDNMIVCNDEKLASGGTAEYIRSAKELLRDEIFKDDGSPWPNVILAPSFMYGGEDEYILPVEVSNC